MTNLLRGYRFNHLSKSACTVGLILCCVYLYLFAFKSHFEIELETYVDPGTKAFFKVYWAEGKPNFIESQSNRARIGLGRNTLRFFIGGLGSIDYLRIDPIEYVGEVTISSLRISRTGYPTIYLEAENLEKLTPVKDVDSLSLEADGLQIVTNGGDSNLILELDKSAPGLGLSVHLVVMFLILSACLALAELPVKLLADQNYVTVALIVIFVLALVMAGITELVHPDERVHFEAVYYYSNHWFPPSLDSPEIASSFSDYGKSRLSTYEIFYPLAGYFSRLVESFRLPIIMNGRVFVLGLLALLVISSVVKPRFRLFALPLIISPQIWYLYSYSNSESFALVISLIAACQIAVPGSSLNKFLSENRPRYFYIQLAVFGLLAGALILSKINFYLYLLFLLLYIIWRQASGYVSNPARMWSRLVFVGIIALTMYACRVGLDYHANGPDPKARFNEYVAKMAVEQFNPNTQLQDKHPYLLMKQRGIELDFLLNNMQWAARTFSSAFGSYGYTQYFGSDTYYKIMQIFLIALFVLILIFSLIRGSPATHSLILLAAGCAISLVGVSIWGSWVENFQAQGRYLAPMIPMLAIVFYHLREIMNMKVIGSIAICMFLMSVYSFMYVGLLQIDKISYFSG